MLPLILHEAALDEMGEAITWYESKEHGLGTALRESIEHAFAKIQRDPSSHQVVEGSGIRRRLIERFPFSIIYVIFDEDHIFIISVFHTSRNPIIWRGRLD
jgi:plasmid stabilization system protein ParE